MIRFFKESILLIWKLVVPDKSLSLSLRKLLEDKKARQVIGIPILIGVFILMIVDHPVQALEGVNDESPLVVSQEVIITESSLQWPVQGYISQYYSWYHPGLDIAGNDYLPVKPITVGKVVLIENSFFGYGKNIMILHGDGMVSRYAHLDTIYVVLNQEVNQDTVLGLVGSTGWVTGAHLHFEVYQYGGTLDPLSLLPDQSEQYETASYLDSLEIINGAKTETNSIADSLIISIYNSQIPVKETSNGFIEPIAYTYAIASPSAVVQTDINLVTIE